MDLDLSLATILNALNNQASCNLDKTFVIKHITSLETAGSNDLAVIFDRGDNSVFDPVSTEKIVQSSAGLFLAKNPIVAGKNYLLVDDVLTAFTMIINYVKNNQNSELLKTPEVFDAVLIDPSAIV